MFSSRLAQWREGRQVQQVSQPKQAKQRTMKGKVRVCLIGLAGCVICAAWALVIQSGAVVADPPPHNHGGGGGEEETPVEFGCVELADADGDGIKSDGVLDGDPELYDYCHEGRKLVVVLGDGFVFKVDRKERHLQLDLRGMKLMEIDEEGKLIATDTDFEFPAGSMFEGKLVIDTANLAWFGIGDVAYEGEVDQQDLWRNKLDDPTTTDDDVVPAKPTSVEVRGNLLFGKTGKEEWNLRFNEFRGRNPLTVTRTGPDTWTIESSGNATLGDIHFSADNSRALGPVHFKMTYKAN